MYSTHVKRLTLFDKYLEIGQESQRDTGEVRVRNDDSGQLDLTFDASVKCDFWDDLMVYGYY